MDEFELIERFFTRASGAGVVIGVGDDGAVLAPAADRDLVTVVDTLVAGTHFPPDLDAADVGFRAVAVNLSDIAAMAARPRWMTLALTLPAADPAWLAAFAEGLFAAANPHGVALVGGDTTAGTCRVVTVQITGDVAEGMALRRSGARPGDTLYVTGTLGDAAAALALAREGRVDAALEARFRRPAARVAYGASLGGRASAAIDVSDGLLGDAGKLARASGVALVIELERLPLSAALTGAVDGAAARRFALTGGDDYELLFSADPAALPDPDGLAVTAIGRVESGDDVRCLEGGRDVEVKDLSYRHFA